MEEEEDMRKLTERLKENREKAYERRLENERIKKEETLKKRRERRIVKKNKIIENIAQEMLSTTTPKIQMNSKETTMKKQTGEKKKKKTMSTEEKRAYEREKKRKQREKIKADPAALEKAREYERRRNQKRREEGKFKKITELNRREQKAQRQKWRRNSKIYFMRKKIKLNADTAVEKSPQACLSNNNSPTSSVSSNKKVGRKLVRRDRSKLFRELQREKNKSRSMEALMEKWKKRYYKATKKNNDLSPSPSKKVLMTMKKGTSEVRRRLLFGEALAAQLKSRMKLMKSNTDKQIFYKCLSGSILKKYKCLNEARAFLKRAEIKYRDVSDQEKHLLQHKRKNMKAQAKAARKSIVQSFLENDDNSVMAPGKKDCLTRKKVKKQKRYLLSPLKILHKKFCTTHFNMPYSTFCKLKPFWIVEPTMKCRNTCLCAKHENIKLVFQKLRSLKLVEGNLMEYVEKIVCKKDNKQCMYRTCMRCKSKQFSYDNSNLVSDEDNAKCFQWLKKKRVVVRKKKNIAKKCNITVKEKMVWNVRKLKEEFEKQMVVFLKHEFNYIHQLKTLKELKLNLQSNEALLVIDFSENFSCKYRDEVQGAHFGGSKREITLHTGMCHTEPNKKGMQFASISDDTRHDACAVWAHITPIIDFLKANTNVDTLHIQSDGPTSQYKNKTNFFLFKHLMKNLNFSRATWNFTEPGHGKGTADGVGGHLKRIADKAILHGFDISNANQFFDVVSNNSNVTLFKIETKDISEIDDFVKSNSDDILPIPNTMKLRQIVWDAQEPENLRLRSLSCMQCTGKCDHHRIVPDVWTFAQKTKVSACPTTTSKKQMYTTVYTDNEDVTTVNIGDWVAVIYDDSWYPGIVEAINGNLATVFFMHKTRDSLFWPTKEDKQEIQTKEIFCIIEDAPIPVSSRFFRLKSFKEIDSRVKQFLKEN